MISIGMAAAKSSIRSTVPFCDRARRQRARDQPPHAGVQGRIVEYQAGGVMLVQRRIAILRLEFDFLVRAERLRILVYGKQIFVAGQEIAAVPHALDRLVFLKRPVIRKWVGVKIRR
jgi:hypothetical protein